MFRRILPNFAPVINNKTYSHEKDIHSTIGAQCHLENRYAGHTMLIDPVLADKGTLISALGVNKTPRVHLTIPIQDIIGGVDMVLLTHNHIDHYEPSVPTHLPKEIPFYVQPQDADAIRNDGFTNVIPIEEIKTIDGISIYRTTGHHGFGQIGQMMDLYQVMC